MDDPWGSPWAEDDVQPARSKVNHESSFKTELQTPVRAANLALQVKANSPWDDDAGEDDFGEWSSMPIANKMGGGLDGTADDWNRNTTSNTNLAEHRRQPSPIWHADVASASIPQLDPSLLEIRPIREPSPDPWVTELLSVEKDIVTATRPQELADDGLDDNLAVSEETGEVSNSAQNTISFRSEIPEAVPSKQMITEEVGKALSEGAIMVANDNPRKADIDPPSSRPSSSPSDGSQHEEVAQDSPRTSMDEDPNRPQLQKKEPSKVQELVEHFDQLAVVEEGNDSIDIRDSSPRREGQGTDSEDGDDFGDFEEGHSDGGEEVEDKLEKEQLPATIITDSSHTSVPSTPKARTFHSEVLSPSRVDQKFYGPVEVAIDLSLLDKLYSSDEPSSNEKLFIPDTVPHDSFSSTEQRKTWYRISRYGTMRKHNSGDDESYTRVSWRQSSIRDETLKIVARWMEEDRMNGHVVLGGGSKASSSFGWNDARAPPVPLAAAFAANRSKRNSAPIPSAVAAVPTDTLSGTLLNGQSMISPQRKVSAGVMSPLANKGNLLPDPVVDFGWNAISHSRQASFDHVPASPVSDYISIPKTNAPSPEMVASVRTSISSVRPTATPETLSVLESPQRTPIPADDEQDSVARAQATTTSSLVAKIAEDDDWGDMVSSPVVTGAPTFPSPKVFSHKTSQSLLTQIPPMPKSPSSPLDPMETVHRPISSCDDLYSPSHQSHVPSSTTHSSADVFPVSPQTTQNQVTGDPTNPTISTTSSDPWATADFSFFDSSPAPAPPSSIPTAKPSTSVPKSVSFTDTPTQILPQPPQPQRRTDQKSKEEAEQDRIVESILKGLPDLSYMLRK